MDTRRDLAGTSSHFFVLNQINQLLELLAMVEHERIYQVMFIIVSYNVVMQMLEWVLSSPLVQVHFILSLKWAAIVEDSGYFRTKL